MRDVSLTRVLGYDEAELERALPDSAFDQIRPHDRVVLKPNWVLESHHYRRDEWDYVITHPAVITAVLRKVIARLHGTGSIAILDGPTTEASFQRLISRYPVARWQQLAIAAAVPLEIIDLRDWEWTVRNDVVVDRRRRPGDPRGKTEVTLRGEASEFFGHQKSKRGYYGADYDRSETNRAHDGRINLYSVSRTALEADVFVNLPKLKTHRKAGITCCLKNLVGINTYKNFLPHHSEGGPAEGGDQFPTDAVSSRIESSLMGFVKQRLLTNVTLARTIAPLRSVGLRVFGDTREVTRSGNWYGNDTIWRMILDLNKVLFYANPDGTLREGSISGAKRFIGVVDAVLAGQGHGPLAPDPIRMGYLAVGTNPVAIDAACAVLMGFDPRRIPAIARSFEIRNYRICDFAFDDIVVRYAGAAVGLDDIPRDWVVPFEPQAGWKGHVEQRHVELR